MERRGPCCGPSGACRGASRCVASWIRFICSRCDVNLSTTMPCSAASGASACHAVTRLDQLPARHLSPIVLLLARPAPHHAHGLSHVHPTLHADLSKSCSSGADCQSPRPAPARVRGHPSATPRDVREKSEEADHDSRQPLTSCSRCSLRSTQQLASTPCGSSRPGTTLSRHARCFPVPPAVQISARCSVLSRRTLPLCGSSS